jgi:hypothetical protein
LYHNKISSQGHRSRNYNGFALIEYSQGGTSFSQSSNFHYDASAVTGLIGQSSLPLPTVPVASGVVAINNGARWRRNPGNVGPGCGGVSGSAVLKGLRRARSLLQLIVFLPIRNRCRGLLRILLSVLLG